MFSLPSHAASPLFAVAANQLGLQLSMMSDSALTCDVTTSGFTLVDTRPRVKNVFQVWVKLRGLQHHFLTLTAMHSDKYLIIAN